MITKNDNYKNLTDFEESQFARNSAAAVKKTKIPKFTLREPIPYEPVLLLPSRLGLIEFEFILHQLSGRELLVVAQEEGTIDASILAVIERESLKAVSFSMVDPNLHQVGEEIRKRLGEHGLALFLTPIIDVFAGLPTEIPSEILKALTKLGIPVTPLAICRPEDNILKTFHLVNSSPTRVTIGKVLDGDQLTSENVLEEFLSCAEENFSDRKFLEKSLPEMLVKAFYDYGSTKKVIDGNDGSELDFQKIFAASLAFADYLKKNVSNKRVGLALPPGKGGIIANIGTILAKKIPVNLNFTASKEAIQSAIEQAKLDKIITAAPIVEKFPSIPWPSKDSKVLLDRLSMRLKPATISWLFKLKMTSCEKLIETLELESVRAEDEAVLLFTSGSSGQPKGVPLTHRNLLANVCQFSSRVKIPYDSKILGSLPLFHSFGLTVTLLFPILEGIHLVLYPNPLDAKSIGDLIHKHEITLLTATPTFLRGYVKRIDTNKLRSLKLVVTGAEKLPESLVEKFDEKFGIRPTQGYGLTETSPVAFLNVRPLTKTEQNHEVLTEKEGAAGLPLAGVAAKITHPETGERLPISQPGLIWVKGANIFNGYLDNPEKTSEVLKDGWFNTGDIGRIDEHGFLFIEGRLSRFSKVGGEMVSHEAVEQKLIQLMNSSNDSDELQLAIIGIPDEKKGEALVLITTNQKLKNLFEFQKLIKKCQAVDLPSLWRPKNAIVVSEIPILASGKLDFVTCQKLAGGEA